LFLILLAFSIGCASTPGKLVQIKYSRENEVSKWPDKKLENQFRLYWSKRFTGPIEDGYNMENPYFREMISLGKYRNYVQNAIKNKLLKMEVHEIERVSEYMVKIECTALIQTGESKPAEVMLADRWVFVDKKWWHVIRDPILSL
jgi:hypothetical protein